MEEAGDGGELVGALDTVGDFGVDVSRERDVYDGGGGAGEELVDEGAVGWGGEDGDGEVSREEEAGEVEEWDGVAFGHEREQNNMTIIVRGV